MENIEEKLIALVQVKTVLYDTSDTDYMRTRYKQQIWDEIGDEFAIFKHKKAFFKILGTGTNT
jgi:Alcohol dehydrogenase transcription factor Myb/SANT-like.